MSFDIKTIALVGAENPLNTVEELWEMIHLNDLWPKMGCRISPKPEFDIINLNDGRDFLKQDRRYDAVVLMHIFNGGNYFSRTDDPMLRVSDLQSIPNWRNRLRSSGAKLIDAFHYLNDAKLFDALGLVKPAEATRRRSCYTAMDFDFPEYAQVPYGPDPLVHSFLVDPIHLIAWAKQADPESAIGQMARIQAERVAGMLEKPFAKKQPALLTIERGWDRHRY